MHKPEALATSGRLFTQKYKINDDSDLQPAKGGQYYMVKCGQGNGFSSSVSYQLKYLLHH